VGFSEGGPAACREAHCLGWKRNVQRTGGWCSIWNSSLFVPRLYGNRRGDRWLSSCDVAIGRATDTHSWTRVAFWLSACRCARGLASGLGAALSSIGYGSVLTFSVLLFLSQQWPDAWAAVTCFSAALVVARILIGHLPDKFGGAVTALVFVLLEFMGLLILWLAPGPVIGLIGVVIVGVGY
jgi:hypothetical protein